MHHAVKDWADGGLTDIDQLAPACDVHNRRVGSKPGQYTTRIITDGPDTGRVAWRLNAAPGMPPNPEHINRAADVAADFRDYLATTRVETSATTGTITHLADRRRRHTRTSTDGAGAGAGQVVDAGVGTDAAGAGADAGGGAAGEGVGRVDVTAWAGRGEWRDDPGNPPTPYSISIVDHLSLIHI